MNTIVLSASLFSCYSLCGTGLECKDCPAVCYMGDENNEPVCSYSPNLMPIGEGCPGEEVTLRPSAILKGYIEIDRIKFRIYQKLQKKKE